VVKRVVLPVIGLVLIALSVVFGIITREEAKKLVSNPRETRKISNETPAFRRMPFEDVQVTTADGLRLYGWFIPAAGRATVMLVHGYKDSRSSMLSVAEILHHRGYQVLVASLRGHDVNDGDRVSFGLREMKDLGAFHEYLRAKPGVDPARVGVFGVSMGGTISIRFAAATPGIRALVSDCAFSSVADTVGTSVRFFTGLPEFPFAPAIVFWTEWELGGSVDDLDATKWISQIAPRPVLLLQGGADEVVSPESGARLFEAAGEPKELWFDADVGHAEFLKKRPAEFEQRVTRFYDKHLAARSR
jgi:alpha-beta hydrolase superfamily lysophospholipase